MIIPFFIPHAGCPHQCVFCNQKKITGQKGHEISALPEKISRYLETRHSQEDAYVAFYGGTFTALPSGLQSAYLQAVQPFLESGKIKSIRLSTRPDYISREILALLKNNRVSTVELGVQSMNDDVLSYSGRGHTAADTVNAVLMLREYELEIGMQLMPGLPGDSEEKFADTVQKTIELNPDFVRLYPALVIKDTGLEELYREGRYSPLTLERAVEMCKKAILKFEAAGIDVIRIGLQPTEELEKEGTILAGPYHPAFRQLVQSSLLLDRMRSLLLEHSVLVRDAVFLVHESEMSYAVGQKRSNIEVLKREFGLKDVLVKADPASQPGTMKLLT